jgi:hypothetical protein
VFATTVGLIALAAAPAALAAAPSNDAFGGATSISSLPFSDSLDTTEATTDSDDTEANQDCGAPATEASVWYKLAGDDSGVLVDVSNSDYSAGVIVVTGTPGSFSLVTCGPGSVAFTADSGTTYYILAFDDTTGSGNGGQLSLDVSEFSPATVDAISVNGTAKFHKDGSATVTGTVTCSGDVVYSEIDLSMTQSVGRVRINGFGFTNGFACDGTAQPWSVDVNGDNGLFKGGKAKVSVDAFVCDLITCSDTFTSANVNLKK